MLASLTNINKFYNGNQVLKNVSLTIDESDKIGLVGNNGCGKSTLLNMLGALDSPDSGHVIIDGVDLATHKDLSDFRRHEIGFIFQLHNHNQDYYLYLQTQDY